MDATYLS